jgi:hypothetical protein
MSLSCARCADVRVLADGPNEPSRAPLLLFALLCTGFAGLVEELIRLRGDLLHASGTKARATASQWHSFRAGGTWQKKDRHPIDLFVRGHNHWHPTEPGGSLSARDVGSVWRVPSRAAQLLR